MQSTRMFFRAVRVIVWLAVALPELRAESTAFTYQGFLTANGGPVNGSNDFLFALFTAEVGGAQVGASVQTNGVGVTNGLFTVALDFGGGPFDGAARWLHIATRPAGGLGFTNLVPRQALSPAPYAIHAASAATAVSAASAGTVTGTVSASQITGTLTNLGAASGGLVLSPAENINLLNAGYVKIGAVRTGDLWQLRGAGANPAGRRFSTAVWTGSEMIVWGGSGASPLGDGARYNPAANSWSAVSALGAPSPRFRHTAVWAGNEMIVWGGNNSVSSFNDGARYSPLLNAWVPMATNAAPAARAAHVAVWTGDEMIVWGGNDVSFNYFNDGGRYRPASNSWSALPLSGAPTARAFHTAVWSDSEMIVWGGNNGTNNVGDGGRYHPALNSWTATSNAGAPAARQNHTAVWTGSAMIVWGGITGNVGATAVNAGARYNPASDSWVALTTNGAPAARYQHTAVWTGTEMVVWGGGVTNTSIQLNTGGRYNPLIDVWSPVATNGSPAGRRSHTAVWTGSEMIVWGGGILASYQSDGGRYRPAVDAWSPGSGAGAPAARSEHSTVWTGSEMIVWGGGDVSFNYFNDGGRYNPVANSWTATAVSGAPSGRRLHTAVWTGAEMLVWGGSSASSTTVNDGGRYNPVGDTWLAISNTLANSPAGRRSHTAVWTGREMIVWGGDGAGFTFLNTGGRYDPQANTWTAIPNSLPNTPVERTAHTAVWTGTEMIVWGGNKADFLGVLGGRYDPVANAWTAVSTASMPSLRSAHTAVWTGTEMMVWGGFNTLGTLNDGGRYSPASDTWSSITATGAPSVRKNHTAVWTGGEMIIWGGYNTGNLNTGGRYDPSTGGWSAVDVLGAPAARSLHSAVWTGSELTVWGGSGDSAALNDTWSYTPGKVMFLYHKP